MSCVKDETKLVYPNDEFKKMVNTEKQGVEKSIKEGKASSVLNENKGKHIANWSDKR